MADPSQIYHTSGTPPLLFYKGNEIIGGTVTSVDKRKDTFLMGVIQMPRYDAKFGYVLSGELIEITNREN